MMSDEDSSFEIPTSKHELEKLVKTQYEELKAAFGKINGMEPLSRNYPKLLEEIQCNYDFLQYLINLFDTEPTLDFKNIADSMRKFCVRRKRAAEAFHYKIQDARDTPLAARMDVDVVVKKPEQNLQPALDRMTARVGELTAQLKAKTEELDRLQTTIQRGGFGSPHAASEDKIRQIEEEAAMLKRQLAEANAKHRTEQERAAQLDQQVAILRENDEKKNLRYDEMLLAAGQQKSEYQTKYLEAVNRIQTSDNQRAQAERNVEYYITRVHELETQLEASKRAAVDQREMKILEDQIAALNTQNLINKQDFAEERQEKERIFREKLNVQQEMLKLKEANARLRQQVAELRSPYSK